MKERKKQEAACKPDKFNKLIIHLEIELVQPKSSTYQRDGAIRL